MIRVAAVSACVALAGLVVLAQDEKAIDAGKRIYEDEKCATCHQIAGHGNSRFPLDGVGAKLAADDIRRWFTHTAEMEAARPKQPAIRMSSRKYKLNEAELSALVSYMQSLK